ncbi:MAG: PqqD family protein [Ignavibacteriales bacterium]|nr:PqqD family protein [Ignavibacteriales bacterium]
MALNKLRNKKLEKANYLDLTPFKRYKEEIAENGTVKVLLPKFTNKFVVKYLVPKMKSSFIKINLDEFGSETWLQIDGEKNVASIGEELKKKFGEKINPVNERLTKFLTQLYTSRFISFNELKKKGD